MKTLPRKKIPASQRMRVHLEVGQAGNFIDLCPGAEAYLWIGSDKTCFGCVPDRSVEKLRDMCNAILERRKIKSV